MTKRIERMIRSGCMVSFCQIPALGVVHVVLALEASRQDPVVAGCPF